MEDFVDYVGYAMAPGDVSIGDPTEAADANGGHGELKRHADSEGAMETLREMTDVRRGADIMGRPT